ncbi:DUF3866 family protein [Thermosediminibacter oceani]|uniref:DUF3866 domain-containing protein n=1 Tax=Thermosediminibacter oceani (strain ATCC BAA-1034 / DSM 16646 / JW/IW-1228P) TaxID=555079 RepID=D9S3Q4_THEOJ|nr:DUF3866 family protein [Thermosediminibacter oceani]ADL08031.1 conserved hypothetical protein [Thermosediminibacter oceani DSM 16646]
MIRLREGVVLDVLEERPGVQELLVEVDGEKNKAINYPDLTGNCRKGDKVLLNTTALFLKLGTGGFHFVIYNHSVNRLEAGGPGHIMKLRYTPFQIKCLSAEEEASPFRNKFMKTESLDGMPVIIGSLHSMLAPACAAIKAKSPTLKIAYVMTDGGALPIFFSRTVYELKKKKLLDLTVTSGHAFGGDLEAVNIYSGLLAARASGCDIAVVAMGPGIVGTGTKYGHTGLEQGEIINAVNILNGTAIVIPRISFSDQRKRHQGVSHHTITSLLEIALTRAFVVIPKMHDGKLGVVMTQLKNCGITKKHSIIVEDGMGGIELLRASGIELRTMSRRFEEDPEFFLAAGAAGTFAAKIILNRRDGGWREWIFSRLRSTLGTFFPVKY